MPFAVDVEAMKPPKPDDPNAKLLISMDMAKPPVKQIPFLDFPRCIYKHPREPFRVVIHRNAKFEEVGQERIPAEHISKLVANEKELKQALAEGWKKEPFIPAQAEDPNAALYAAPEDEEK